jgi:hypothetical protein
MGIDMLKASQYSTHIPVLIKALRMTEGAVLEMGAGFFSTPIIHWLCVPHRRYVTTLESNTQFLELALNFKDTYHRVKSVKNWEEAKIESDWGMAFIDHDPASRRRHDLARLANCARLIVLHDTSPAQDHSFGYKDIYPLFKYIYHYWDIFPGTSMLSNYIDLDGINIFN